PTDREWSPHTEADRVNGRTEPAAGGSAECRSRCASRKDRPRRISQRAHADRSRRKAGARGARAGGIDDGAAGHLPDQSDHAADRQHKTDLDLRPLLRRQINRDEWTETGLNIREKEKKPVEAAQALR